MELTLLRTGDSILINNIELVLARRTIATSDGTSSVAVFTNAAMEEAVFTWRGVVVAGQLHSQSGVFCLEGCGVGCYLWIEQTGDWQDEKHDILGLTNSTFGNSKGLVKSLKVML